MPLNSRKSEQVVITGIGMISPLGLNVAECWTNMLQGLSGIGWIKRFDSTGCPIQIAGEIPEGYYELEQRAFHERAYTRIGMPSRLAILCANQAIQEAGLACLSPSSNRIALVTGCSSPGFADHIASHVEKRSDCNLDHGLINSLAECVSRWLGFGGPSFNVAAACASGAYAVGLGRDYVKNTGETCVVIGVDTMLQKRTIEGFNELLVLAEVNQNPEKTSRPFDADRSGFVLSEGACALVLEREDKAVRRGARIYANIAGYAMTSESYNILAPEPEGAEAATTMELALANAQVPKEMVGYIDAHGTSTRQGDLAETRAIKRVFGSEAYNIPVSSQKSMIGHTVGAAGTIECAVTALSLYHQVVTPTINYDYPDEECDLDYVPNKSRSIPWLEAAISNSFGFGGHNCTIVLERSIPKPLSSSGIPSQ